MKAFISDIHANLEALCSVMDDIARQDVSEIICLGDVVGYGADPEACVDMIMNKAKICLKGNHDYALIHGPQGFNSIAADIIRITYDIMHPDDSKQEKKQECFEPQFYACTHKDKYSRCMIMKHTERSRWYFEEHLIESYKEGKLYYVHGSPLNPVSEYIFPDRLVRWWNAEQIARYFEKIDYLLFCGHTHVPCIITSKAECIYPDQVAYKKVRLDPKEKYIINTGSVGQPRDRDNRACYLLYDEEGGAVEWRRVTYDIETAMQKTGEMCGKESWCSMRLMMGR